MTDDARAKLLLQLRLINDAQERGATWASIAKTLGYSSGKAAKNDVKKTARRLEKLLRVEAEGAVRGDD